MRIVNVHLLSLQNLPKAWVAEPHKILIAVKYNLYKLQKYKIICLNQMALGIFKFVKSWSRKYSLKIGNAFTLLNVDLWLFNYLMLASWSMFCVLDAQKHFLVMHICNMVLPMEGQWTTIRIIVSGYLKILFQICGKKYIFPNTYQYFVQIFLCTRNKQNLLFKQ